MGEAPTRYLSTPQAAALLGLSPRTLERYRVTGGGPPFLSYCNRVHYLRSDLDAWAARCRKRSTSDDGGAESGRGRDRRADRESRTAETGNGRAVPSRILAPETQAGAEATGPTAATETGSDHLSVRELAALLQVSRRTLDRYRARGAGPAFRKVDGRIVYARADVETWLASSRRASTPDNGGDAPGSAAEPAGGAVDAHPGAREGAG